MPTYSYRCTECDTAFDIQQSFTDDSLTRCPTCSGKLRKVFTAIGVSFTGSGFYRNDSRAEAKEGSKSTSSPDTSAKGGSDSGSSEKSSPKSTESTPSAPPASEKKSVSAPATSASSTSS